MKNFRKLFLASTILALSSSSFLGAMDNKNVDMPDKKSNNTSSTSSLCNNSNIYDVKSMLTEELLVRALGINFQKLQELESSPKSTHAEKIKALIQLGNMYTYTASGGCDFESADQAFAYYNQLIKYPNIKEINLDAFLIALYMVGERFYTYYIKEACKDGSLRYKLALPYLEEFISYDRSQELNLEFWLNTQYVIGKMYYTGDGVDKKDIDQALTHLEKVVAHEKAINSPAYILSKKLIAKIENEKNNH
jgi:hypothetical protein